MQIIHVTSLKADLEVLLGNSKYALYPGFVADGNLHMCSFAEARRRISTPALKEDPPHCIKFRQVGRRPACVQVINNRAIKLNRSSPCTFFGMGFFNFSNTAFSVS
jgi:hypothetical protein